MAHRRRGRGAVPVLLAGREPDHVTGPDFFDGAALALNPAETGGHDQGLAEWMRMPSRAGARFEGDESAADAGRDRAG